MKCEENNTYSMSKICLEAWENEQLYLFEEDCFPKYINAIVSTISTIWCSANAIFGFTGNLLTLIAIPYVAKTKKYLFYLIVILGSD